MYNCTFCRRDFQTETALHAHCRDKIDHPYCMSCERVFTSLTALDQHLTNAAVHKDNNPSVYYLSDEESDDDDEDYFCYQCNRIFADAQGLWQHRLNSPKHNWCFACDRDFSTATALLQHTSSRVHNAKDFKCPLCPKMFKVPSAIALHIESGGCNPKITRYHIAQAVHSLNISPTISVNKRIQGGAPQKLVTYQATELAWNGKAYECYICHKTFRTLQALNSHLDSPAHDSDEFKCPKCNRRFTCISGLVQHVESEVCGITKFKEVKDRMLDITAQFTRALKW